MGNKAIEVIERPSFKSTSLPFHAVDVAEFSNYSAADLETHLTAVYKALQRTSTRAASNTSHSGISGGESNATNERSKILAYLMSIGSNAEVANIVLNTNFCYLLLRLLKGISSRPSSRDAYSNSNSRRDANSSDTVGSTTRVVAVTVLASMLRFATYIQPPSHKNKDDHLLPVLVSVMKSLEDISGGSMGNSQKGSINSSSRQDIKIKRRCMAALGETLFYISSQEDSNTDQGSWALPMALSVLSFGACAMILMKLSVTML